MSSNSDKNTHGKYGQLSIDELIKSLLDKEYISDYQTKVFLGYPDKDKQFYSQFLVEFLDGEKWVLHSTTSIRDRIAIQQWNSEHSKNIDEQIKKAFVIYPDNISEEELKKAMAYNKKITENKIFSALDGVVSQTEIYNLIEAKALENKKAGSVKAKQGLNFEIRIAEILSNEQNLNIWKNNDTLKTGLYYSTFKKIVDVLGLVPDDIENLSATADDKIIGQLPTGGKAKTDVLLTITKTNGTTEKHTFSCKRTSEKRVSAHQYSAKSFCEILKITDEKLKSALFEFQRVGGYTSLDKETLEYLIEHLKPYHKDLALWVYGGIGGYGNPDTQWAKYIITYKNDTSECDIYSVEDYIQKVEENKPLVHLETIFEWTFASGEKGKSIQLKSWVI